MCVRVVGAGGGVEGRALGVESLCTQMPKIKGITQKLEGSSEVTSILMGCSPSETRQGFSVLSSGPRMAPRPAERHKHRFKDNKALGASSRLHWKVTFIKRDRIGGGGRDGGEWAQGKFFKLSGAGEGCSLTQVWLQF